MPDLHGWDDNKSEAERVFESLIKVLPLSKDEAWAYLIDESGHSPQYCRSYLKVWTIRKRLVEKDGLIYENNGVALKNKSKRRKRETDDKGEKLIDSKGNHWDTQLEVDTAEERYRNESRGGES